MAEDDIYGNKARYERFIANLEQLKELPKAKSKKGATRKYYCKNPSNLTYFKKLAKIFESRDTSYVRRLRVFCTLLFIVNTTKKNLTECDRDDINEIVALAHEVNKSSQSKADFIKNLKFIWKDLFPEKDEKGRTDDTLTPFVVRHLSKRIDKSKQKLKDDRLTWEEFEKLVNYFSNDPQMQFYLNLSVESLGRPQEICYTRISDLEINENHARIFISSHGKEGTKFLQCIDSYPYLLKFYDQHKFKQDKDSFLFIANGRKDKQLTPYNINKKLRKACKKIGLNKRITAYSLKRNGVTFSRLRGDSDVEIQHRAGWTSTRQLSTYDLSNNLDSYRKELAKRGLIDDPKYKQFLPKTKTCICGRSVGFAEKVCPFCKRLLDRKKAIEREQLKEELLNALIPSMKEALAEKIKENPRLIEIINKLK
ncbi:site-specific integrase [Candidatus Woesearchaeota archaeon]|nr:site-specific integrase [Candidatus Woesearchaeota archaeon]